MDNTIHIVNNVHTKTVYFSEESKQVDCKSVMFGLMVELAQETVESFHSDFYYDAIFIEKLVLDHAMEFYFLFGESGTNIVYEKDSSGLSPYNLAMSLRKYSRPFVYKVEVQPKGNWDSKAWVLRFTCLATDKEVLPAYNYNASFNAGA